MGYTKGQWELVGNEIHSEGVLVAYATNEFFKNGTTQETAKSNSKLIVCAPEMLKMLEQSLYRLENTNNVAFCDSIRQLISKATTL